MAKTFKLKKKKLTHLQSTIAQRGLKIPPSYTEYEDEDGMFYLEVDLGMGELYDYCFDTESERQDFININLGYEEN